MLIDIIKDYKFYDRKSEKYTLSASLIADDILQIWHEQQGTEPNAFELNDATLGSILHLGLELVFSQANKSFTIEQRFSKMIGKWTISGKIDLLDTERNTIYDFKSAKNYSRKSLKKEGRFHRYAIQLAIYNWLLGGGYIAKILWIMKDSNALNLEPTFVEEEIEIMAASEIEDYIKSKTDSLEFYGNEMPDVCSDLWARKVNGALVNSRCLCYCKYSNSCKYNKPTLKGSIARW